jgi:hypothetical protein
MAPVLPMKNENAALWAALRRAHIQFNLTGRSIGKKARCIFKEASPQQI